MKRIGLVFGAGGVVGEAFHHGVLRAMLDLDMDPGAAQVIVGTSAGSIVAASVRRRASGGVAPLDHRPHGILGGRAGALELVRRPRQLLNAVLLAPELANGRMSLEFLRESLQINHGLDWPAAPLWVVAVRRRDGRRVVFGMAGEPTADVGSAVAASCAVPAYLSAVEIDGVAYVDGGVHSPTNADLLAPCDLDTVVISSPMSMEPRAALRPRLDSAFRLLFHQYLTEECWVLRRQGRQVISIEPDRAVLQTMGLNMMNGHRIDEVEEAAYALATRKLVHLAERVAAA